ncbi:MAG: aldolase [Nitrospina sp.]|jgi:hypothetical protein|nr:aldolase [Nitrospina sp.]MBT6717195.1 aldolase [Nitrospina sp.]
MRSKKTSLKIMPVKKAETFQTTLARSLRRLKNEFGACGLKLSTEDAAMTIDQIKFWAEASLLPSIVKIGGPNARNDIKQLVPLNIEGLIAPMVESPYGLENFIAAVRDFTTPMRFGRLNKHINIETVTAIKQLDDILNSPEAKFLDEITIGCSDLSGSMKRSGVDRTVLNRVVRAVKKIQSKKLPVSVGGGIQPETIDGFLEKVRPDKFNTRVVTFDVVPGQKYGQAVAEALKFEILMLEHDAGMGFITRDEEKFRIKELKKRLK